MGNVKTVGTRIETEEDTVVRSRLNGLSVEYMLGGNYIQLGRDSGDRLTLHPEDVPDVMKLMASAQERMGLPPREDAPSLLAEVERLRTALKFYANATNYEHPFTTIDHHYDMMGFSAVDEDEGERAREALSP